MFIMFSDFPFGKTHKVPPPSHVIAVMLGHVRDENKATLFFILFFKALEEIVKPMNAARSESHGVLPEKNEERKGVGLRAWARSTEITVLKFLFFSIANNRGNEISRMKSCEPLL